jgi:hypothetical protein
MYKLDYIQAIGCCIISENDFIIKSYKNEKSAKEYLNKLNNKSEVK